VSREWMVETRQCVHRTLKARTRLSPRDRAGFAGESSAGSGKARYSFHERSGMPDKQGGTAEMIRPCWGWIF
jgi:hypothetical protein